jgi:hypothetical protein
MTKEAEALLRKFESIYSKEKPKPLEEAEYFSNLSKHFTKTKIANTLGVSRAYIYVRIQLLNLIPELKNLLNNEEIQVWDAYQISKKNPEVQKKYLDGFEKGENK